jgi:protein TonB
MMEDELLRRKDYFVTIKIWVKPDGEVERIELDHGNEDAEIAKAIRKNLDRLKRISEAPPANMPQPIKLKIKSKL